MLYVGIDGADEHHDVCFTDEGSGQIGVKMHDKRGGGPPEPVVVNSSSDICSR
jgi:hypothetical protein